jgi:hypothetical protein
MPVFENMSAEPLITSALAVITIVAIFVPFTRGIRLCFKGRSATRRLTKAEYGPNAGVGARGVEPIALTMLQVLRRSLRERASDMPTEFVVDATRQYVVSEYEAHYMKPISMYANLLPPIGFIGNALGLLVLFVSMRMSDSNLEVSGLAVALTATICALMGFAILEGYKIRLYARLLACLDDVVVSARASSEKLAA